MALYHGASSHLENREPYSCGSGAVSAVPGAAVEDSLPGGTTPAGAVVAGTLALGTGAGATDAVIADDGSLAPIVAPTVDESLLLRFGGIGGIPNMLRAFDSWLSFLGTAEVPEPTPVTPPVLAVAPGTATGAADPTAMALLLVGATDPAAMALLAATPSTATGATDPASMAVLHGSTTSTTTRISHGTTSRSSLHRTWSH